MIRVVSTAPSVVANEGGEALLVQRACRGDQEAFAELYQVHAPAIYRYFYLRLRDHQIAEDLTGEVFLQVVEALPRFVNRGRPFASWLFRIARYRVIDYYRRTRTARAVGMDTVMPELRHEGSETLVMQRLDHRHLHAQIGLLTDDQKTVVQLRFFEGYSLEDTAAIMDKNASAIKSLQRRALQQLARKVTRWNDQR